MIAFADDIRNQMIGGKKILVGQMSNVDGIRVQFLWNGKKAGISTEQGKQLFAPAEWFAFAVVVAGALYALSGLITGYITI